VRITRTAIKDIKALDRSTRERVLSLLEKVAASPKSKGGPLKGGFKGMWRYRIGKIRILAVIDEENKVLAVHRVVWRKKAYGEGER
jgi:mRNA interferase RelE/StbE